MLKSVLPFDIAWVAILLCGVPILVGAFRGVVFERDIKADLLVSLALIASAATGEFFAAGEVALIMQIGSLLEDYTSGKAKEGIEKLIKMTPQTARVRRDGGERVIPAEDAGATVRKLNAAGVTPMLLTGDNEAAARAISAEVGISDVRANLLPEDKMRIIKDYAGGSEPVCMVGDGVNAALLLRLRDD